MRSYILNANIEDTVFAKLIKDSDGAYTNLFNYNGRHYLIISSNDYSKKYKYPGYSEDIEEGFYRISGINDIDLTFDFCQKVDIERETPTWDDILEFMKEFQMSHPNDILTNIEKYENELGTHFYIMDLIRPLRMFKDINGIIHFEENNALRYGKTTTYPVSITIREYGERVSDPAIIYKAMVGYNYDMDSYIGTNDNGLYIHSYDENDGSSCYDEIYTFRGSIFKFPVNQHGDPLNKIYMWEMYFKDRFDNSEEINYACNQLRKSQDFLDNLDESLYSYHEATKYDKAIKTLSDCFPNDSNEVRHLIKYAYDFELFDFYRFLNDELYFIILSYQNFHLIPPEFSLTQITEFETFVYNVNEKFKKALSKKIQKGIIPLPK